MNEISVSKILSQIKDISSDDNIINSGRIQGINIYKSNLNILITKKKDEKEKDFVFVENEIKKSLTRNEACEIRGFGRFSTNKQKRRMGRNPKTGEKIEVPEKKTIHFKIAKEFFNKIND